MQMILSAKTSGLEQLLDAIVDGQHDKTKFAISLEGVSASVLMQVFEVMQIERATVTLAP